LAKIPDIQLQNLFSRLGAFLLLVIFLSIPLIEALHHHVNSGEGIFDSVHRQPAAGMRSGITAHQLSFQKLNHNLEKKLTATPVKCKICDLIRNHTQHACLNHTPTISFHIQVLQTLRWHFIPQSSADFMLACANKGPPVIIL